jgi:hypothetical protein
METNINNQISIIQGQTNYSLIEAGDKLIEFNMDHIKVIKNYLNIPEKKEPIIKSIQQEMYKQMRLKLDDSIKEFNIIQDKKLESEIEKNNNLY